MKKNDRKRFLTALLKTRVSLPGPTLNPEEQALRNDVFWEEMEQYSIDDVEESFKWARGEFEFFPTPSSLIEHIKENKNQEYLSYKTIEQQNLIPWKEPTREGKDYATQLMKELREKWNQEDKKAEEERKQRFENRRVELQKQARLLKNK